MKQAKQYFFVSLKCTKRKEIKGTRRTQKSERNKANSKKEVLDKKKSAVKRNISEEAGTSKVRIPKHPSPPKTIPDEGKTECLVCGDTFENSAAGEKWVQCNICEY